VARDGRVDDACDLIGVSALCIWTSDKLEDTICIELFCGKFWVLWRGVRDRRRGSFKAQLRDAASQAPTLQEQGCRCMVACCCSVKSYVVHRTNPRT
jgi:hypothetical protein